MAITTSPSKDRLFHPKRRSLGHDDLSLASAVNRATGVSPLDTAHRARRRRISQGGGWAKGRDRSHSRPRLLPGALTHVLDKARKVGRDYIWPVIVWILVLIPALLSLLVLVAVLVIVAVPLATTFYDVACQIAPPAVPRWLSSLPGPFKPQNLCVFPTQTAEQAILNDPTAIEALNILTWPSAEVRKLQAHQRITKNGIRVGFVAAQIIKRQPYPHPRGLEVADLLDEWTQRHEKSHELMKWLLYAQTTLRESISWEARQAEAVIDAAKAQMADVEPNQTTLWSQSNFEGLKSVWIPGYFAQTPIGKVVGDLERNARKHVQYAETITKTVPWFLQALENEKKVVENLKVTLPLNWNELVNPADYDVGKHFEALQNFLQYDFEQWLQGCLTLAVRFQKESDLLAEKLTDAALALRRVRWSRKQRVKMMRLWRRHGEALSATWADARAKFDAAYKGPIASDMG